MPRVIALTSDKGGVGKSTLAVHLAGAFCARGLQTVLIDEDGRVGSSLRWAARARAGGGAGLGFPVLAPGAVQPGRLAGADAVLIDTEGRLRRKTLRRLATRADVIVVPCGAGTLELEATRALLDVLTEEAGAARKTRVVLTRVPPLGRAAQEVRESLRDEGVTVCNTVVRSAAAYHQAAERGALARDMPGARAGAAWHDMLALSRELL